MKIDELKARVRSGPGRLRSAAVVSVVGLGLLAGTVYAGAPAGTQQPGQVEVSPWPAQAERPGSDRPSREQERQGLERQGLEREGLEREGLEQEGLEQEGLEEMAARVERVTDAWAGLASYYEDNVAPIESALLRYSRDTALVERISMALVREANRVGLEPRLLLAVLLVENPWLDPDIRSPVGAIGLMQVMPLHRGGWSECDSDLEDVDANICHGASIFAHYFRASNENLERALLRYNGCVNGTNTPNCHQYPNHVFAHAGRASVMAWLGQSPGAGTP